MKSNTPGKFARPSSYIRSKQFWDLLFLLFGAGLTALFTTRYLMPFRLDDVLLMEWSNNHSLWQAFDPIKGQIVNSVRPVFAMTSWLLTHISGVSRPFLWHLTLTVSLLNGIAFTGLTARYVSRKWPALQLSVMLYFIAFTSILNVFFWYSDLTYGLELCFTAPAWYFGIRGLLEGRIGFWFIAILSGSLAILSKEPAIILVHLVLLGTASLNWRTVQEAWSSQRPRYRILSILGYLFLCVITLYIIAASPTRSNRFFTAETPNLGFLISDRIRYYSSIYLNPASRILLFAPVIYLFLRHYLKQKQLTSLGGKLLLVGVSLIIAATCCKSILIAVPLVVIVLGILASGRSEEAKIVRLLIPFAAALLIAMTTLLFTIQLVKTQLTEAALLTAIISSWGWVATAEDLRADFAGRLRTPRSKRIALGLAVIIGIAALIKSIPVFARQEAILRDARSVRLNANDAVQWSAEHLPTNAMLAVTSYSLHGIGYGESLTAQDDQTKLRDQFTFAGGYVYTYLEQLGRRDIRHAYLEDTLLVPRVLDAMRRESNDYLFLQSEQDVEQFHSSSEFLIDSDSLVARFSYGPYPCEIWKLQMNTKMPDRSQNE